ncbi:MAG: nitrate/nitrite transporter NrtS [Candidatus Binatia bacterium]
MRKFFVYWLRRETVSRALKVAGVIGPLLTVINHYDTLLSLDLSPRLLVKIALTFLVPYCVSSFSSARAYMDSEGRQSIASGGSKPEEVLVPSSGDPAGR